MSSNILYCSVDTITTPTAETIVIPRCSSPNIHINEYKLTYQYISGDAESHIKNVSITFSDGNGGGPHEILSVSGWENYCDNYNTWHPFSGITHNIETGISNISSGTSTRGFLTFTIGDEASCGGALGTVAEVKFYINNTLLSSRYYSANNGWKEYSVFFIIP